MDIGNLSRLESGKSGYSRDTIERIAKVLSVSVGVLFAEPEEVEGAAIRFRQVPLLTASQLATWRGPEDFDEDESQEYLHTKLSLVSRFSFAIRVVDEANAPAVQVGDELIFDANRQPKMGSFVLAQDAEGTVYLGRFRYQKAADGSAAKYEVVPADLLYPIGSSLAVEGLMLRGTLAEHRKYPA